ncbi:hypothetical protein [Streptomyces sp. NPDC050848]|uniref:hypothetical protein n=1 Tax=Streptomyces sp. NPDC050848 TaxID=3155791 RepID=UPI0033BFE069
MRTSPEPSPTTYLMLTPGSPESYAVAGQPADVVVIDLQRAEQRLGAVIALLSGRQPGRRQERWVGLRPAHSPGYEAELDAIADLGDGLIIPGIEDVGTLHRIARRRPGTPLIPVIDSVRALTLAPSLARHPSVVRLGLTTVASSTELTDGMLTLDNTVAWAHRLVAAASTAAGLPGPVGGLHSGLSDPDTVFADAELAARCGFTGYCVNTTSLLARACDLFPSRFLEGIAEGPTEESGDGRGLTLQPT